MSVNEQTGKREKEAINRKRLMKWERQRGREIQKERERERKDSKEDRERERDRNKQREIEKERGGNILIDKKTET